MAGKPKLLIIQACTGVLRDRVVTDPQPPTSSLHPSFLLSSVTNSPTTGFSSSSATTLTTPPEPNTVSAPMLMPMSSAVLDTDDLIIWQASFPGHVAHRHTRYGSWFVTAVVESLSKHACHRDLKTLFDNQIKKKVRNRSIEHGDGQNPTMIENLQKKLFLFPGYNPPPPD
ncbi:caspase-6-like isoform X1 [Watersipora subatra]|uniref:caspase-6-like isoform X1 n=1 Tax=Watersipora subatra TaxID=2589382 RepID=UPI00355C8BD5